MEQRRSRSSADADLPRVRVLSLWAVLGIALLVAATLALLFPRQALIDQIHLENGNDSLTENYLSNLLRTEPHNYELRILLAEKRFALGQIPAARDVLEFAIASQDPDIRRRALLLDYRILGSGIPATDVDVAARPEQLAALRARLSLLALEQWGPKDLVFLSQQARRWGIPATATRLAERLLAPGTSATVEQLTAAAAEALGSGDYKLASNFYFAARPRAKDRDRQRELYLLGVATLQSGNLLHEALAAADAQLGDLKDDEQTLTRLARLALAANEPARAQSYVRRLLRMSSVSPAGYRAGSGAASAARRLIERMLALFVSDARAQPASGAAPPAPVVALRPYDEEIYTLAFDVFLANGNVADACRVAEAAVAQRPEDMGWRTKLAKASEWSAKPDQALVHWLVLARRTGSEEAYQAILRLAPGLPEYEPLLFAWKHEASRRTLDRKEWRFIADVYEVMGRPDEGITYLEEQFAAKSDPVILETLAIFQERARRSDGAIKSLERLMALSGPNPSLAVRLATLLFLRSDFSRAYAVLQPQQASAAAEDGVYWKLLADLAWQLQQDDTALTAYGTLERGNSAQEADMERLVVLMRPRRPEEAQRLALLSWRRFHSVSGMLVALEMANERRDFVHMGQLLEEIRAEDEARLSSNAYYFTLRASYFQGTGNVRRAIEESRRALALTPQSPDLRVAHLWMLVDARALAEARTELRGRLREWNASASASRVYWDAYAAAYQVLGESRRALPWLARQAANRGSDYVWLSNYADALDEAGNAGMAWRVRRHAWLLARAKLTESAPQPPTTTAARDAMLAYARLAISVAPGDTALAAMRRLLRQDSPEAAASDTGTRKLDAATTELVLAWTLGEERYDAAREWMWTRYARRTSAPVWADYTLALAERDWERLDQLLGTQTEGVPVLSRIDAARVTGRTDLAQSLGTEALAGDPDNAELHLRLSTDLLATATGVIARDVLFERGVLQGHEQTARAQVWATPRLRVAVELALYHQHTADQTVLTGVPGTDRSLAVSVLYRHGVDAGNGETELTLGRRNALSDFISASVRLSRPLGERLTAAFGLNLRERAADTVPLQVGGHKDESSLGLQYRASSREYVSGRLWSARFHSQQDSFLGTGRGTSIETGYRIRSEYPDFNVRISRTISHYAAVETADASSSALVPGGATPPGSFFLPQSFRLWGINAGFGTAVREERSRALRPFLDVGRSANSASGSGYNWLMGAGGSLIGPDHASIYWLRSKGGGGANVTVRELGLRYQYFFD